MYWNYREKNICGTSSCVLCREIVHISERPLPEIPLAVLWVMRNMPAHIMGDEDSRHCQVILLRLMYPRHPRVAQKLIAAIKIIRIVNY
jgi:hypothetical protein